MTADNAAAWPTAASNMPMTANGYVPILMCGNINKAWRNDHGVSWRNAAAAAIMANDRPMCIQRPAVANGVNTGVFQWYANGGSRNASNVLIPIY